MKHCLAECPLPVTSGQINQSDSRTQGSMKKDEPFKNFPVEQCVPEFRKITHPSMQSNVGETLRSTMCLSVVSDRSILPMTSDLYNSRCRCSNIIRKNDDTFLFTIRSACGNNEKSKVNNVTYHSYI